MGFDDRPAFDFRWWCFHSALVGVAMERGTVTVRSWLEGSVNGLFSYIFFVFYDRLGMVNGA